jgi:hypothetical protein
VRALPHPFDSHNLEWDDDAHGAPPHARVSLEFLGSPDFLPKQQVPMVYQYNDSFSWTLGKHNLKMGATVYLPMRNLFQDEPGMRGDLTFNGVFSGLGTATVKGTTNARDYADGLFGATQYTQLTNVYFVEQRLWLASGFFEDDWKATQLRRSAQRPQLCRLVRPQ